MTPTSKSDTTFRLQYIVKTTIRANPEAVWAVLTDIAQFPKWNSTVSEMSGSAVLGEKITIKSKLAPDRTFTPKVTAFESGKRMVWSDGFWPMFLGERVFTLEACPEGTVFVMDETFSGLMLPMIKGSLPDFRASFDTYAADLKAKLEAA